MAEEDCALTFLSYVWVNIDNWEDGDVSPLLLNTSSYRIPTQIVSVTKSLWFNHPDLENKSYLAIHAS